MITRIGASQRVHFVGDPARGRTIRSARSPARPTWEDADGTGHAHRRATDVRGANLDRYVR